MIRALCFCLLVLFAVPLSAQVIPFESSVWKVEGIVHQIMDYRGNQALFLKGASAELTDVTFTNGEVEFDIAFSGERSFAARQHLRRFREARLDGGNEE